MEESFNKITMAVSSCLLGNEVRFDGEHGRDGNITDTFSDYIQYVPVCTEVECGIPGFWESTRITETLVMKREALEQYDLDGFIFNSQCPLHDTNGETGCDFAHIFKQHFPLLPTEEGRLHDPKLWRNFIESVFVYRRWRKAVKEQSAGALINFHSRHKFLLQAHNEALYREMGPITANAGKKGLPERLDNYQQLLMQTMQSLPTSKTHTNILMHLMGFFKKKLTGDEKQDLLAVINQFKESHIPLGVPIDMINHYVKKYSESYLMQQYYLNPHPLELTLRNLV